MFIHLSMKRGILPDRIAGYEVCKTNDGFWIIKWDTDDGCIESDAIPSEEKLLDYLSDIERRIKKACSPAREPFDGDDD